MAERGGYQWCDRNCNGDDVYDKDDGDDGDDGVDPKDTANLLSSLSASCQKLSHLELPGKSSQQNQGEQIKRLMDRSNY